MFRGPKNGARNAKLFLRAPPNGYVPFNHHSIARGMVESNIVISNKEKRKRNAMCDGDKYSRKSRWTSS